MTWLVLQLTSKASVLLRHVLEHLNVVDRQYFGLRFVHDDDHSQEPVSYLIVLMAKWRSSSLETDLRAAECHLLYGIAQCHPT